MNGAARPGADGGVARVAAIDCGTNSVRLLVADVDRAAGRLSDVDRRLEIVRLGQGVDATGRLADDALARALHVLRSYRQIIEEASASAIRMGRRQRRRVRRRGPRHPGGRARGAQRRG